MGTVSQEQLRPRFPAPLSCLGRENTWGCTRALNLREAAVKNHWCGGKPVEHNLGSCGLEYWGQCAPDREDPVGGRGPEQGYVTLRTKGSRSQGSQGWERWHPAQSGNSRLFFRISAPNHPSITHPFCPESSSRCEDGWHA